MPSVSEIHFVELRQIYFQKQTEKLISFNRIAISYIRHLQNTLEYSDDGNVQSSSAYESTYPDTHAHVWKTQNHLQHHLTAPITNTSQSINTSVAQSSPYFSS